MTTFPAIDETELVAFVAGNKGITVIVTRTDGTEVLGDILSINSKGLNVKDDGKTISISVARVSRVSEFLADADDVTCDDMDDDCDHTNVRPFTPAGPGTPASVCIDCGTGLGITSDDADDDATGHTTAEVAAMFGMTAKELRVQLRALGMGVGKGRTYGLSDGDVTVIRKALTPTV